MKAKATQKGFSLIEAMVTTLVLGVGVAGLANLYTTTHRGLRASEARSRAAKLAQQLSERLDATAMDSLPDCAGPLSCRSDMNTFAPPLPDDPGGFQCSQRVSGGAFVGSGSGSGSGSMNNPEQGAFRVDMVVENHPDLAMGDDARLVTVSVCWLESGAVHQVQARRMKVRK